MWCHLPLSLSRPPFCPEATCPSLFFPSPADPSCSCYSPIVVHIFFTAAPYYVYNLQVAKYFASRFADALKDAAPVTPSQVKSSLLR